MLDLMNKEVLVIGLGGRGRAACELLRRHGAIVTAVDNADTADLRDGADKLRPLGIEVALGVNAPPKRDYSFAVISPAAWTDTPLPTITSAPTPACFAISRRSIGPSFRVKLSHACVNWICRFREK